MTMVFSTDVPIDQASMDVIADAMIAEHCWNAYIFQHWDGEWLWTKKEANLPIDGYVTSVSLVRYWQ